MKQTFDDVGASHGINCEGEILTPARLNAYLNRLEGKIVDLQQDNRKLKKQMIESITKRLENAIEHFKRRGVKYER